MFWISGPQPASYLIQAGYQTRVLYRSEEAKRHIVSSMTDGCDDRIELVSGDLFDFPALTRGMQGAEYVFHCAAKAALGGQYAEFERDNVTGTHNVIAAATACHIKRLVHVSSDAVCVRGTPWGLLAPMAGVDEGSEVAPPAWAPYSKSKALAERAVLEACSTSSSPGGQGWSLETVVVRPHRLWGAGDTVILGALLGTFRSGMWRWFTPPALTTTTHVLNACRGLQLAAERGEPGEVYFVTAGEVLGTRDFFTRYAQAADPHLPAPHTSLPFWLAWMAAWAREVLLPFLPPHPLLTRQALAVLGRTVTVRDAKIRRQLGFENVVGVVDGLEQMGQQQTQQ